MLDRALMGLEAILKVTSTAPDCETIKTINNGLRVALARTTNPWRPRSYKLYSLKKPNLMYKSDRTPTKRGVPRAFLSVKASLVVRLRRIAKNRPQRQTFSKAWRNFDILPEIDSKYEWQRSCEGPKIVGGGSSDSHNSYRFVIAVNTSWSDDGWLGLALM